MRTIFTIFILAFSAAFAHAQSAKEIVQKAQDTFEGESNYMEMSMTIVRPGWTRNISLKTCNKGTDYSMTLISEPAKEKGQTFMKRKNEIWSWNPKIRRLIKLPPSMMSQGWMGSDFSNDELLNKSSLTDDYNHKIIGTEKLAGKSCYKIELTPKKGNHIIWGKQIKWISKGDYLMLKTEYYDDENYLLKTEKASQIKNMNGRNIPTYFELIPADEAGNKTIVKLTQAVYDISVSPSFFSQQNMKKGEALKFPVK